MKTSAIKNFTKTVAATMSAVFAFTLIPMALGQNAVIAATAITKDQSNTSLGVSGIKDPTSGGDTTSPWTGSYVYFGNYNGPIKFRVLHVDSTAHTTSEALFLDSDSILFDKRFDGASDVWKDSELYAHLNDNSTTGFLNSFTELEQQAIASNTKLNGEKIFVLDEGEATNSAYGYGNTTYSCASRMKTGGAHDCWWLRSAAFDIIGHIDVYYVHDEGFLNGGIVSDNVAGVAPALNINQSSIMFSTKIKDLGNDFGEYKLTLLDDKLKIAVPDGQQLAVSGTTVTVPYLISGDHAANATRASILILDENNENIEFYAALEGIFSNSAAATGSFTFPDSLDLGDWGTKYHVYILAEDINGTYETDYASDKFCIDNLAPTTFKVTYKVVNGTWSDGTTADKIVSVAEGSAPIRIPTSMIASSGYEEGSWNTDLSKATISADATFTYTFKATIFTVTVQNDGNGTASADVTSGIIGTEVTLTATPSSGYLFQEWQVVSGGVTVTDNKFTIGTSDVTVKAIFEAIPTYTVTVQNDGNGTATANVTSGPEGTEVTLTATPSSGYQFKEWQVVSGGVSVTDNKFTIGTSDVTVKAIFEAIPTYTVTVQNDCNGTATADVTSGPEGTEVTLTATPSSGYQFKEWQVVSGGVTVTDNKFTIGTSDVTVKAVFEAKPVSVEPPKSTGPFTYTVVGGGDSTWTEGDPDLVVKVTSDEDGDHSFDRYEYTAIDGTKLTDEQAPASSGSTVITIKSDLLKTLSEGKHTILVNFSDNSITTTVTIVKKAAGTSNVPSTGEMIGVSAIAGTVLILSACSILIVMRTKKREDEQ